MLWVGAFFLLASGPWGSVSEASCLPSTVVDPGPVVDLGDRVIFVPRHHRVVGLVQDPLRKIVVVIQEVEVRSTLGVALVVFDQEGREGRVVESNTSIQKGESQISR